MSVILLPTGIQAELFSKWCSTSDLMKVDSASTNRIWRESLLNIFQLNYFDTEDCFYSRSNYFLTRYYSNIKWLLARKVKLSKLHCRLGFIQIRLFDDAFWLLIKNIRKVSLFNNFSARHELSNDFLIKIVKNCHDLEEFLIDFGELRSPDISLHLISQLILLNPKLKVLKYEYAEKDIKGGNYHCCWSQ
jgi:hypothetical protein